MSNQLQQLHEEFAQSPSSHLWGELDLVTEHKENKKGVRYIVAQDDCIMENRLAINLSNEVLNYYNTMCNLCISAAKSKPIDKQYIYSNVPCTCAMFIDYMDEHYPPTSTPPQCLHPDQSGS